MSASDPFKSEAKVHFAEAHFLGVTAGIRQWEGVQCATFVLPDNHRMHLTRVALELWP